MSWEVMERMRFFRVARGAIRAPWQDKPPSANYGGRAEVLWVMQPNASHADVRNLCFFGSREDLWFAVR